MDIEGILVQKRSSVLERWFKMIARAYPAETARFLEQGGDRFANPVGHTIVRTTEAVYDALIQRKGADAVSEQLDSMVRIRAVQEVSPAQAVAFVFFLKTAIREEFDDKIRRGTVADQLVELESRIDDMALLAFDLYVKCREEIYKLRHDEVKRQTAVFSKMAARGRGRRADNTT